MSTRTLSYAQAASLALEEAMAANPKVVALGEDLGRGGVFGQYRATDGRPLAATFGFDRVIDTPISEAAIMARAWAWRSRACAPWSSCAWSISRSARSTNW